MTKNRKILLIAVCIVFVAVVIFVGFSVFTVKKVNADFSLSESGKDKAVAIQDKLDGYIGKNLLFFNTDEIKSVVEQDPYLEVVSLKKSYPNVIDISVKERQGIFAIEYNSKKYVLSDEGIVLSELEENYEQRDYVALSIAGYTIEKLNIGQKIVLNDKDCLNNLLVISYAYEYNDCVKSMSVEKIHDTKTLGYQTYITLNTYSGVQIAIWNAERNGVEKVEKAFNAYNTEESDYKKSSNKIDVYEDETGKIVVKWDKENN